MHINLLCTVLLILAVQRGVALECYKCPVGMKDILFCGDPFENLHYQTHCDPSEDVCLKISATGSSNHVEERGCAKESLVPTICGRVRKNFPDATCLVCHGDLCNASSRNTSSLVLFSISVLVLTIYGLIT
ncbi:hypothetical protein C0J52_11413 [Blattella germanica]|nr:hypothetical protein C0J52_11413 [Blattella germanica]